MSGPTAGLSFGPGGGQNGSDKHNLPTLNAFDVILNRSV